MTEPADQRMTLRFVADDLAWIAEQATDEGVDNATMVRMIVNRLRRGRAPLISMMEAKPKTERSLTLQEYAEVYEQREASAETSAGLADDVMQARLAELGETTAEVYHLQQEREAAAMPLRRVASSTLYNPRPK